MKLILMRCGYPPFAVRPADRKAYVDALEHARLTGDTGILAELPARRLGETLAEHIAACRQEGA
jgi:hypothetical protein